MPFPQIPTVWYGDTPRPELTFADLQGALQLGFCAVSIEKDVWLFTNLRQRIWNQLRVWVIGEGIERSTSKGTHITVFFYCYHEGPPGDSRTVTISTTETLSPECVYVRTDVRQVQQQVERSWARWRLNLYFEDDDTSANVENAVASILSIFGLVLSGPAQVAYGVIEAGMSLTGFDVNADYVFVTRDQTRPERSWVNAGPPSSHLGDGPRRLPAEECEERVGLRAAGEGGLTTAVAIPE